MPAFRHPRNHVTQIFIGALLLGVWHLALADSVMPENPTTESVGSNANSEPPIKTQEAATQENNNQGRVARAIFTSQITDREPTDSLTELENNAERIFFFTDLRGLEGQIITHQWEYAGNVMADVKFRVGGGPRWRVYSSKNLLPEWIGQWSVSVMDENGTTLNVSTFDYTASASEKETTDKP